MDDNRSRAWFVGVDWASRDHHAVVVDATGRKLGERSFRHGGEGLAALAAWITALTEAQPDTVAVAIEAPHGPVVETLMARGFRVHAINPKQLDRFRDRFSPAGAKDDSRDAQVLADALRTDPRCLRRLQPLDPSVVELRECSRLLEDLRHDRNRLANRVRELLWRYFPAMLELDDDVAAPWFLDLWERVPTPAKAARVRTATVERLLKRHRIRRFEAGHVLHRLRQPAVATAAGTVDAATAHLQVVVERLRLVNRQIKDAEKRLDQLTEQLATAATDTENTATMQRDVTILRSLPGPERSGGAGSSSPRCSQKPPKPCSVETTTRCAACVGSRRSPSDRASRGSCSAARPPTTASPTPPTTGPG